jgi:hypothetical protein
VPPAASHRRSILLQRLRCHLNPSSTEGYGMTAGAPLALPTGWRCTHPLHLHALRWCSRRLFYRQHYTALVEWPHLMSSFTCIGITIWKAACRGLPHLAAQLQRRQKCEGCRQERGYASDRSCCCPGSACTETPLQCAVEVDAVTKPEPLVAFKAQTHCKIASLSLSSICKQHAK